MAVQNNIRKTTPQTDQSSVVIFMAGNEEVRLTKPMVKSYLISGDPEKVTDQELTVFMMMCKANHLNPWIREAYCIKYGDSPATMVVGKDAFMKRAERHPAYDGMESGIIIQNSETGEITYRQGILKLSGEKVVGGWAEVFRTDRNHSTRIEVSFDEYAGRKKDGSLNAQWSGKPGTMIRKVAQVQALKEAFPDDLGGMMTAEEQGVEETSPTMAPINAPQIDMMDAEIVKKPATQAAIEDDDNGSLL